MPTVYHPCGLGDVIVARIQSLKPNSLSQLFQNTYSALTGSRLYDSTPVYRRVGVLSLALVVPKSGFQLPLEDENGRQMSIILEDASRNPEADAESMLRLDESTGQAAICIASMWCTWKTRKRYDQAPSDELGSGGRFFVAIKPYLCWADVYFWCR